MTDVSAMAFDRFFAALTDEERRTLAHDYATRARSDGAYVLQADGREVPIPPILTPVAMARPAMAAVSSDAHAITAALVKLTADLMHDEARAGLRQRLFAAFTPLEAEALRTGWRKAEQLATVRVDFLVDELGRARALEVNATIPAMQGYSDAIAAAFIRSVAALRKLPPSLAEELVEANGRNSDDLLASLLAHHQRLGGRAREQTIAIIARPGDAQLGELQHYVRRWSALGHHAFIATPDQVQLREGHALVDGIAPDVIYRHIFARRLDPQSTFARVCLEAERHHLFNPISSHLEVKGVLALLSAAAASGEESARIGLDDDERATILRAVPWTRLLLPGPATGPSGEAIPDFPAWVREHGRLLVLKRSWDYGGKGVFLGNELDESAAAQARLQALVGGGTKAPASWAELCDFALVDRDAWVVQELVVAPPRQLARADAAAAAGAVGADADERRPNGVVTRALYVDLSAFTNVGQAPRPSGGAVRASESRIVNILGGGGLAPLLRADVLEKLLAA